MKHDQLYLKYEDSNGNEHLQSVSDLREVGALIEGDGPNEGNEMELVDDNFYDSNGYLFNVN